MKNIPTPKRILASLAGFTLIELMVVISIIGVLSSLSLASLTQVREKARITRALAFETNLYRGLGADAALIMDFEEAVGNTANDSSANNNHGVITGANWSPDTFNGIGSKRSLRFIGAQNVLAAKPLGIGDRNFTVAHWLKPVSIYSQRYTISADYGDRNGFRFGFTGANDGDIATILIFMGNSDIAGGYTEKSCGTADIRKNRWSYIAAAFDRANKVVTCYVDGVMTGKVDLPSGYYGMVERPPKIGRAWCCHDIGNDYFLDDVRVYTQNLSGVSIKKIYDETKDKYLARN